MSIVTRTGDKGLTGLYGTDRVSKASERIEAYGTVNELNAFLGVVLSENNLPKNIHAQMERVQHLLFTVGADLAKPLATVTAGRTPAPDKKGESHALPKNEKRIRENHVGTLERWIDELEPTIPPRNSFILPGGSKPGSALHLACTVCRRAERCIVALKEKEPINPQCLIFVNRLSDYLFLTAQAANRVEGVEEPAVRYE
ncbi:cob(I)yrinic acid a,c-diamide adenosyltransferase [Candidatus Peregrinibacteria bacterium]|nr:cob(I)yrinic acid a,c-diamide adenosyltransferase [Candidatus Peregrinibacteria bacterium]